MTESTAYIGLGSNLGDRLDYLRCAVCALRKQPGVELTEVAGVYETAPVGGPPGQRLYLNSALSVCTSLSADELLDIFLGIETSLGRVRSEPAAPRTIDLDLLLFDDVVMNSPRLTLPHPRMHQREFVLQPLSEIAGDAVHPVRGLTINDLLTRVGTSLAKSGISRVSDARWAKIAQAHAS